MELRDLIILLRRWAWLIVLGLLVGLAGGYLASDYMEPVYEASTKIMISREIQDENPDFAGLNSQQLVQTYVQILKTKPLLESTSEMIGAEVDSEQVSVQQILDTQIIEIKVEDPDPEKSARIANTMVSVLIEQNEEMQTGQYSSLETRLTKQLEQVESNIDNLQTEFDQAIEQDYQEQLKLVEAQLDLTRDELLTLQSDMALLRPDWRPEDRITMAEKQAQVDQLRVIDGIYEEIHANLLILERPYRYNNLEIAPRLQQLQSTLDLYQELYLNLVGELERVRLARLQQTPSVFQIEEASVPEKPVRPIPLLYTLLSGMVGMMFAVGLVFFIEALKQEPKISESSKRSGEPWIPEQPDAPEMTNRAGAKRILPEEE